MSNGSNLKIDFSFDPAKHAPRNGTLVRNPKQLIYQKGNQDSMMWDCDIDTKEGDFVFFDYLACLVALGKLAHPISRGELPSWFRVDRELYVVIRYDALVFAFRETGSHVGADVEFNGEPGEIICLNGQVIMRPRINKIDSALILPENVKTKEDKVVCDVVFVGNPNREYLDGNKDCASVVKDDRVIIKNFMIRVENNLSNLLSPGLVYVQQKNIWAKLG
jgi:hypothetical protein